MSDAIEPKNTMAMSCWSRSLLKLTALSDDELKAMLDEIGLVAWIQVWALKRNNGDVYANAERLAKAMVQVSRAHTPLV